MQLSGAHRKSVKANSWFAYFCVAYGLSQFINSEITLMQSK